MKIAVIGYSGAGKSTMAKRLAERLDCPVLYLDKIQFQPGWKERDKEEGKQLVREFMEREASWVIDGNYTSFLQKERLLEADQILFFNFPRRICLIQAVRRYLGERGQVRESIADGCVEKLDLEFILWILWKGRTGKKGGITGRY